MSLQEIERSLNEKTKTLKQGEKAVAKGFQDLPPEIIGIIMSYCSTADKKEMRCVSKWCFIVVSTASKELKLLFGTYTIKNVDESDYSQISEVLSNAMNRSYGPEVRLDLEIQEYPVSSDQIKILSIYKDNIVSLDLVDPEILLQPHLEFTNIQRLVIYFRYVHERLHNNICEGILARYGDKLEHLGVQYLEIPNNSVLHLSKLESLELEVNKNIVCIFVNAINKENITHLSLKCIFRLDNLIFPKLQHLELLGSGISGDVALALIKCHKNTITKLKLSYVKFRNSDIGDVKIPNLQYLELLCIPDDVALPLIKCNKDTITNLQWRNVIYTNSDIGDIKIPKLQYLELSTIPGDVALSLIENNKDTICEIRLRNPDFRNTSLPVVKMPRLKRLYLWDYREVLATSEPKLIKAFGRNIEELWPFDYQISNYVRKSREELNNLKLKALALQ